MNQSEERTDCPLCPYCGSRIVLFCPPENDVKRITLYCPNGLCKGVDTGGHKVGYDIHITDLKYIYEKGAYRPNRVASFAFQLTRLLTGRT